MQARAGRGVGVDIIFQSCWELLLFPSVAPKKTFLQFFDNKPYLYLEKWCSIIYLFTFLCCCISHTALCFGTVCESERLI